MDIDDEKMRSNAIKLVYDLISWFIMQSGMIRVSSFKANAIDLPNESPCKIALHLGKNTHDYIREGNLVLIELDI